MQPSLALHLCSLMNKMNLWIEDDHTGRSLRRGSWSLGYWGREFESRWRRWCLSSSFCIMLSCGGRCLCDGLIPRPGSHTKCQTVEVQNCLLGCTAV
jgi:hypothetical protein